MPDARPEPAGFFGREADLTRVCELLADEGATVTLVGPPGVGKTRLAREVVRRGGALDAMACDLSEARTPDDVTATIAERLGVTNRSGEPSRSWSPTRSASAAVCS